MDLGLTGKIVAITGGSRGIGRRIAEAVAAEGASVAIAARSHADLGTAHAAIEAAGRPCLAYACDLSEPGEAAAFVGAVAEVFGGVDALICAAGRGSVSSLQEAPRAQWEACFGLNLFHAVEAAQAAAPVMAGGGGGSIVFVSSISGARPVPFGWQYGAAKAALNHAAGSLAVELAAHNVRVNALAPGSTFVSRGGWDRRAAEDPERFETFVARELPFGRLGRAEDVAAVAAFLASERSAGISGAIIPVDGAQGHPTW